jgi:glyoxylase-like metal-dependent hydrolase (beta-lactamase superfamily II)
MSDWREIGDRVFVRRYRLYDQNISVLVGHEGCLVIDTRISPSQAREIIDDLRVLTPLPVTLVVNTHGHSDHAFGNRTFRPAPILGHEGCVRFLRATGEAQKAAVRNDVTPVSAEMDEVVIDPPDRTFTDRLAIEHDGRPIDMRFLGRGHTDHDIVVSIPDANVVFAGDLFESGAPPFFGDGYPMDWPATAEALVALVGDGTAVPGHGDPGGADFANAQLEVFRAIASLALEVHEGLASLDDVVARAPFPLDAARDPIERALAQLRGELD